MALTERELQIISEHSLSAILDPFQLKLRDLDTYESSTDAAERKWRNVISSLLLTLVGTPTAFVIPSKTTKKNLAEDILSIYNSIGGGNLSYEDFRPLVHLVIEKASDTEIWSAVLALVNDLTSNAFVASLAASRQGTPVRSSSNRLASSETREIVEKELFFEIKDVIYRNVGGFFDKYFDAKTWNKKEKQMLRKILGEHNGRRWKNFPEDPWETAVWSWLIDLEEMALADAPYKLHSNRTAHEFKERKGQMDIFFQQQSKRGQFTYKNVLIVGEHKRSIENFKSTLLQLTRHVRGVFSEQPTRRFVHAFFLRSFKMELWVFDRSGAYSSGEFDIHAEPEKFARALVGYATMNDEKLGIDTFIRHQSGQRFIIARDNDSKEKRYRLDRMLVNQQAIVCRGTTVFKTGPNVVKFAWASDKRISEVDHLTLAAENGVEGVAKVQAYQRITSVEEQRKGLTFPSRHKFNDLASSRDAPGSSLPSHITSANPSRTSNPSRAPNPSQTSSNLSHVTCSSSGQKRVSSSDESAPKRLRKSSLDLTIQRGSSNKSAKRLPSKSLSSDQGLQAEHSSGKSTASDPTRDLPSSSTTVSKASKYTSSGSAPIRRSSRNSSRAIPVRPFSSEKLRPSSCASSLDDRFDNRIFSCLVVSPAGRVISNFTSVRELLEALRDAIRAHRSLLTKGSTLHRDISDNNIIITSDGDFKGVLIDLDLAKRLDSGPSGARYQTGTMQFMAIEVLKRADHTYRHDLESFFYVLLWMVLRYSWVNGFGGEEEPPRTSRLRKWEIGSFTDIADAKRLHMSLDGLEEILEELPTALDVVRPLCMKIRAILFGDTARLATGTPKGDPERLYKSILTAYDETIDELSGDEDHPDTLNDHE